MRFSSHTVATVGYGNMYPIDVLTNVIVVTEITFGLLFFALASGLIFGRFSRQTARVLFSNVAVVKNFEGVRTLMFRAANQRHNFVFEANVRCLETIEGKQMRRFYDLKLDRASRPYSALTWLIMHRIDDASPLFELDQRTYEAAGIEIVVSLTELDSSVGQSIHAGTAYGPGDVLWDHEFADVLSVDEAGRTLIDYRRFHEVNEL
jgi:inward rectifier potassium channel